MTTTNPLFQRITPFDGGSAYGGFGLPDTTPVTPYPFQGIPNSALTGQKDYLGSISPYMGADLSTTVPDTAATAATGAGGWGSGLGQQLRDIGLIGGTDGQGNKIDGWGGLALGAASGLLNGFMAMKQYGIARDSLNASKEEFNKNYAAQQKQVNASLEDRQRARIASNPGAYESVDSYMKKNGI